MSTQSKPDDRAYQNELASRLGANLERRRKHQQQAPAPSNLEENLANISLEESRSALKVDLCGLYPEDNANSHQTSKFELTQQEPETGGIPPSPVLRRGLSFYMTVRFDRPYNPEIDTIRIHFYFGPRPSVAKGTRAILNVVGDKTLNPKSWDIRIHHQNESTITFQVQIPVTAQVGLWRCLIQTNPSGSEQPRNVHQCQDDIYILFNPWCQDDPVYMEDESLLAEYVENDVGKVWEGAAKYPKGRHWIYGQYDDCILPGICFLMEKSGLTHAERANPVKIVRALSAVINSADDSGLLIGKWKPPYRDGTSPFAWTGSVAIYEKYLMDGGKPVRYGQCWIFSAVMVTACRALGIPCRSVSNFVSAHDTNRTMTIDRFFDSRGDIIPGGPDGDCFDSCWNFHCWNEVWMTRPDLPQGFDGWQAVDATPQEESDGLFRCGPASVKAVRLGEVGLSYDTPFIFSEVNADVHHFVHDSNSSWGFSRSKMDRYHVGQRIVTRQPGPIDLNGNSDLEDITLQYKQEEGSRAEREAVRNAMLGFDRMISTAPILDLNSSTSQENNADVVFDLEEIEHIIIGQPFSVVVNIQNNASELRTIKVSLSANAVIYNGDSIGQLKKEDGEFELPAQQRERLRLQINPADYLKKTRDHSLIKIYAMAKISETGQIWSDEDDFDLRKPSLDIEVQGNLQIGAQSIVRVTLTNPLPVPLTECFFTLEGQGLLNPGRIPFRIILPGEQVTITETFVPRRNGVLQLVTTFISKEMNGVNESINVHV